MVDIMDHDMDLRQNTGQVGGAGGTQTQRTISGVTYSLQNTTTDSNKFRIRLPGEGDPPALIFPGTKEIKVKITWAAPAFTGYKVGIGWRLPGLTQHTWLARQVSGSTWTIGVTPDMWDSGHQWYTLWEFYVYTHQDPAADGTNFRPGIITGNIHVKITVVKGEILPEPPHPKFWESGDTIEVSTHENVIDCSQYSYRLIERDYCRLYLRNGPRIIPPGTGKLRIEMKWNYGTYEGTPTSDLIAVYKPSNMNPWTTPVNEFLPASCTGTGQTRLCEITVKPGEADAYYQKSSSWYFTYAVKGHHEETGDQEFRPFKFTMHILAIKDPSFDEDRAGGA
ncbi:MAG: hypothetical protein HYT80_11450 [Euryarchaeota archaeon]|nr:hypothetical protein [Euryarchaeota archaeon]